MQGFAISVEERVEERTEDEETETINDSSKSCCLEKQRYSSVAEGTHDIKEQFRMETVQHVGVLMSRIPQRRTK